MDFYCCGDRWREGGRAGGGDGDGGGGGAGNMLRVTGDGERRVVMGRGGGDGCLASLLLVTPLPSAPFVER